MEHQCDIAVVGGGAAGLTAAIFAARRAPGCRIVLLDGARKLGAKILVSGGGRCNVTHTVVRPEDFNGPQHFIRHVLAAFDHQATVRWFEEMGVLLKCEATGKLFPVSDDAHTVLNALLNECRTSGVHILADRRVQSIERDSGIRDGFVIGHGHGRLLASRLILATGGCSLPRTGSDGAGWRMVEPLGHSVHPARPALVPLVLDDAFFHQELSGLSLTVELTTFVEGRIADRRTGELLWTHFGISGPVVMDASRHWTIARAEDRTAEMRCHLLPGRDFTAVDRGLAEALGRHPKRTLANLLAEWLPARLAETLVRFAGSDPATPAGHCSRENRRRLVHLLTALPLPVMRDRGWNYAEVTAGGVPLDEVDHRTMTSRLVPGLYLIGEMLDCDGRIGGFNFQWAWSTGYLAGRAAAKSVASV